MTIACLFVSRNLRPRGLAAIAIATFVISGTVEDVFAHRLQGATVVVHDENGKQVARAITAADGKFAFPGI